jgi:hypothetical protein
MTLRTEDPKIIHGTNESYFVSFSNLKSIKDTLQNKSISALLGSGKSMRNIFFMPNVIDINPALMSTKLIDFQNEYGYLIAHDAFHEK